MITSANTNMFDSMTENLPDGDYICTFTRGNQILTTKVKYTEKNYLNFDIGYGFHELNHISGVVSYFADGITMVGEPFPAVGAGNRYTVTKVGYLTSDKLMRGDIILGLIEIDAYFDAVEEIAINEDSTESDYALYFRYKYLDDLPGVKDIIAIQNDGKIRIGIKTDIIVIDGDDKDHVNIKDIETEDDEKYYYYRLAIVRDTENDTKSYYVIDGEHYVSPYSFKFNKFKELGPNGILVSSENYIVDIYMLVLFENPIEFDEDTTDKFNGRNVLELEGIMKYEMIDATEV